VNEGILREHSSKNLRKLVFDLLVLGHRCRVHLMLAQAMSWQIIDLIVPQPLLNVLPGDPEVFAGALKVDLRCLVCRLDAVLETSVHAAGGGNVSSLLVLEVGFDGLLRGQIASS
jgi:hypothetical protein